MGRGGGGRRYEVAKEGMRRRYRRKKERNKQIREEDEGKYRRGKMM